MSNWPTEDHEAMREARRKALEDILDSGAERKLVIGGPGTGKTYTFRQILDTLPSGGHAQILTFLRLLVDDLVDGLGDRASVNTFHGYCKQRLHSDDIEPLSDGFDLYPHLLTLLAEDLRFIDDVDIPVDDLKSRFHRLDNRDDLLDRVLELGNYYDAVAFDDSVYRVLRHFEEDPSRIPYHELIIVDEYQDFNQLETRFLERLAEASPIVFAGDDDQALYEPFRDSSPAFIRELYQAQHTETFELPYCARCPEVIVDATNAIVDQAQTRGHLEGRIPKSFHCFLPDKEDDSKAHPDIIHAHCSVERSNAPYMGRYITEQISQIPKEDIQASVDSSEPTALIIGPGHFVSGVHNTLEETYPSADLRRSPQIGIHLLDALKRLADDPQARLGWRILLHLDPPNDVTEIVESTVPTIELADALPAGYKDPYLGLADLVGKLLRGEALTDGTKARLEEDLELALEEIRRRLDPEDGTGDAQDTQADGLEPRIVCTTFPGAKGLAAPYVFIVGMVDEHFPRDPSAPTDQEICSLLVALSRTRKACHLLSCGNYAGTWVDPSTFIDWLPDRVRRIQVDAEYWKNGS